MRFIERLREIPVANSRQLGRITFGRIYDGKLATDDPDQRLDPSQLDAALRDTPEEERQALYQAAQDTMEDLRGTEAALQVNVSAVQLPNFSELKTVLGMIQEILAPYVAHAATAATSADVAAGSSAGTSGSASAPAAASVPGRISSRQDVLRALEQIRNYYKQHEPASPIPLIVHRLERMVPMTFLEIMNEIAPDGVTQVTTIVGPQP